MREKKSQKIDLQKWVETKGSDFVIKVRGGKPYISRKPKRDPARKKSTGEQRQVNMFKLAVKYAKEVIADPEKKKQYEALARQEARSVYHVAITDYLQKHREQAPAKKLEYQDAVIEKTGSHLFLKILFESPVAFKRMEVTLLELDQTLVENGAAEQATVTAWWYLIQNPSITGLPFRARMKASAEDGATFEAEKVIV
jgi:hypothetical protein